MAKKLGILESLQGQVKSAKKSPAQELEAPESEATTPATPAATKAAKPGRGRGRGGRPKKADPSSSFTIGLSLSLRQELTDVAAKHRVSRNALTIFFIKHGVEQVKSGKLKLPITNEPKLRI